MEALTEEELRIFCPLKWHEGIPTGGIGMGIADIDFPGPQGISEWISSRFKDDWAFYQKKEGMDFAVKAALEYTHKLGLRQVHIQIIPGTMSGIYATMKYISRQEGEIAIINPIYPPIHFHAASENNKISWVSLDEQFSLNIDQLQESVSHSTKLLALVQPNNPTGTVFTDSELKAIRDLAVDYNFICFSDELYSPLVFSKDRKSIGALDGMDTRTISLFGFSKAYGLAGLRAGFMALQLPNSEEIKEIVEHILVSPSPITSLVTEFALKDSRVEKWVREFKTVLRNNTELASNIFDNAGYSCPKPEGGLFVFPDIGEKDDEKFTERLLMEKGVEVVPGSKFGPDGRGRIRINCATSEERLRDGIHRILDFLNQER